MGKAWHNISNWQVSVHPECLDRQKRDDRLKQNGGNSSKPPSSDGAGGTPPARPRKRSGKLRGVQPGHKSHNGQRRMRHPQDERMTVTLHYPAAECRRCGGSMLTHNPPHRAHRVFAFPEVSYFVTEHQLLRATSTHCIHVDEETIRQWYCHQHHGRRGRRFH